MWTLAVGYHEDRTPTHGYEATREAAMSAVGRSPHQGNGVTAGTTPPLGERSACCALTLLKREAAPESGPLSLAMRALEELDARQEAKC
jgi:hypothetical protein